MKYQSSSSEILKARMTTSKLNKENFLSTEHFKSSKINKVNLGNYFNYEQSLKCSEGQADHRFDNLVCYDSTHGCHAPSLLCGKAFGSKPG